MYRVFLCSYLQHFTSHYPTLRRQCLSNMVVNDGANAIHPRHVEFALADPDESDAQFLPETAQRFLLSPGDMFCVPAGNMYLIENHSKTHECKLFWTIIRPAPGDA